MLCQLPPPKKYVCWGKGMAKHCSSKIKKKMEKLIIIVSIILCLILIHGAIGAVFYVKLGLPIGKKFRIKFREVWYSREYTTVWYTNNRGLTWYKILTVADPLMSYEDYETTGQSWKIYDGLKKTLLEKFSSVEKCKKYNENVVEEVKFLNIRRNSDSKKRQKEINEFYKP